MSAIGSWEWLERTGGRLTARERAQLFPKLFGTFAQFMTDRLRLALGASVRHSLGVEDLWSEAPDSRLCRAAEEEAKELQSAAMLHHGYRTWVFGVAFARIDGASLDPESFHVAALLHDVGLEHIEPGRCFTYRSALAARAAAHRAGTAGETALPIMDAIGMHITPGLRREDNLIGHYLQAGAMADLAGIRAWQLPSGLRQRANQRFARADVHEVLSGCWHAEARAVPGGRAHLADKWGGFSRIIRLLPMK